MKLKKTFSLARSYRCRSLLLQLGMMTDSLIHPYLEKDEDFQDAFWERPDGHAITASMAESLEGIRKYQSHPYLRDAIRHSVPWSDGEVRLFWFAAKTGRRRPEPKARILLVPSLINGSEILDILPPDRSLARWLCAQGMDVYLLDWGNVSADPDLSDLDRAVGVKLRNAVSWLGRCSDVPLVGLGYCMGGMFLLAADALCPQAFSAMAFVATPWDFKAGSRRGTFPHALSLWAKDGLPRIASLDHMPSAWLQMIFLGVDPAMTVRKFSAFSRMRGNTKDARLFVAVEDWLTDGPDLPARIAQQAVREWYLENLPFRGRWRVAGEAISARRVRTPSLVIIPGRDKIVPPDSARALLCQIPDAWSLEVDVGHVSMMVAQAAKSQVWEPLRDWILDRI